MIYLLGLYVSKIINFYGTQLAHQFRRMWTNENRSIRSAVRWRLNFLFFLSFFLFWIPTLGREARITLYGHGFFGVPIGWSQSSECYTLQHRTKEEEENVKMRRGGNDDEKNKAEKPEKTTEKEEREEKRERDASAEKRFLFSRGSDRPPLLSTPSQVIVTPLSPSKVKTLSNV